jgi:pyruvate/2-oxoglutarate dehydrogenase complex dihydrolipoamide dehydrogenase (E3) component
MLDLAVIGGGSAGYAAARTAASLGLQTAVIDGAEELGGLCILRGCMPSKALIESANRARTLARAGEFGLGLSVPPQVDAEVIRRRKRALVEDFASYRRGQLGSGTFRLVRGRARFLDPRTLRVEGRDGAVTTVETRTAVVATGSVVSVPDVPGLEEAGYWTSDEALEAGALPESLVVLGGGAIALELAHYFAALGVEVTVVQRGPVLLRSLDPEAGEAVREAFGRRGIRVACGTRLSRVERAGGRKRVIFTRDGVEESAEGDEILVALGRKPALEGLGLETAGVETEGGRVVTGRNQETSAEGVYAAGDVCSPLEVVHLAIAQGETAAWNAARRLGRVAGAEREMDYRLKLFGVFCEPQVAVVGASEEELRASGRKFLTASHPFGDHGMSMVKGETDGFVKLAVDAASGEILGGMAVGPEGVELIHEVAVAMRFRATAAELAGTPHYHPSLAEIWTYPAEELAERVAQGEI